METSGTNHHDSINTSTETETWCRARTECRLASFLSDFSVTAFPWLCCPLGCRCPLVSGALSSRAIEFLANFLPSDSLSPGFTAFSECACAVDGGAGAGLDLGLDDWDKVEDRHGGHVYTCVR